MTRTYARLVQPSGRDDTHPYAAPNIRRSGSSAGPRFSPVAPIEAVDGGTTWAVPAGAWAQVWGSPGSYDLDMAHRWYLALQPGDPQLYALRQQDIAAVEAVQDLYRVAYVTEHEVILPTPVPIASGGLVIVPQIGLYFDTSATFTMVAFTAGSVRVGGTVGAFGAQNVPIPGGVPGSFTVYCTPGGTLTTTAGTNAPIADLTVSARGADWASTTYDATDVTAGYGSYDAAHHPISPATLGSPVVLATSQALHAADFNNGATPGDATGMYLGGQRGLRRLGAGVPAAGHRGDVGHRLRHGPGDLHAAHRLHQPAVRHVPGPVDGVAGSGGGGSTGTAQTNLDGPTGYKVRHDNPRDIITDSSAFGGHAAPSFVSGVRISTTDAWNAYAPGTTTGVGVGFFVCPGLTVDHLYVAP